TNERKMKAKDTQQQQQSTSSTASTSTASSTKTCTFTSFLWIILVAVILRLVLYYQGFHNVLSQRNEISTPLTGFKRLTEGLHLHTLGLSPYAGSAYHQAPLLLLAFMPLHGLHIIASQLMFVLVDVIIAYLLRRITVLAGSVLPQEMGGDPKLAQSNFPNVVAAIYLFNPFTLFTSVGMSTIVFNNLSIIASLYFALSGNMFLSLFSVASAVYISIYPIMLIFPVSYILKRTTASKSSVVFAIKTVLLFIFSLGSLLYISFTLLNSWEFIEKCYWFTFLVEDLTPNIGLFWYYFIEVFEHFRNFFLFIFQYHVFIYTIPLAIRLKNHPLFYFWTLCAIIATFKSYPAMGDTSLHLALLPLLYEPLKGVRYSFIIVVVGIYVTVLAPILWQMWIYQGTGNANFYYTINLVFTLAQVLLIVDSFSVLLKLDYIKKINSRQQQQPQQEGGNSSSGGGKGIKQ
ncbi:hypothetical protein SAMD00019534_066140, partial [Acytostelium subglobosum LB1]|uniref:hypothetical protein n=1 Tax=Acytostelium subglobosum LB1 TaxID=1410327 RepID=UPI000644EE12